MEGAGTVEAGAGNSDRLTIRGNRHLLSQAIAKPARQRATISLENNHPGLRVPLTPSERARLPAMSRCVNCGICALVVGRVGAIRLPDLSTTYLRDHTLLPAATRDPIRGGPWRREATGRAWTLWRRDLAPSAGGAPR